MKIYEIHLAMFLMLFFVFPANAQKATFDESILSENGKQAYQTLLKEETFAFGGTGYAGITSEGELALIVLIKAKQANLALSSLIDTATPEGGLYALVGLRVLKCACFNNSFQSFVKLAERPKKILWTMNTENMGELESSIPEGEVQIMEGCVISTENRVKIANEIKNGKFDNFLDFRENKQNKDNRL